MLEEEQCTCRKKGAAHFSNYANGITVTVPVPRVHLRQCNSDFDFHCKGRVLQKKLTKQTEHTIPEYDSHW